MAEERLLGSRQDCSTRIAMIKCGSQGSDMTIGGLDSSQGDVRAASDCEMMRHKEVHVGKRSHMARHLPSASRFSFTSAQFLFRHEPGGPVIRSYLGRSVRLGRPHQGHRPTTFIASRAFVSRCSWSDNVTSLLFGVISRCSVEDDLDAVEVSVVSWIDSRKTG
ncbi:hypothetical protein Taro_051430 [Colocasia esculenta]|uniref:Uncharacterized protein n=1 Tax=Colocasia esculenta TaxID=4460 RepID=A0A843XH54_COLES|nr:hypothetical protein [Colocasia esculenta]